MTLTMWIALGLLAWVVVPLPLAILVGRLFGGGRGPVEPISESFARPRMDADARQHV